MNADTIPVRTAHAFDVAPLEGYLSRWIPGAARGLRVEQFRGGQSNPTYLVTAADGQFVLRRKPPGALLPSAHAVDREFRIIRSLHGGPVPVPRPICYCDDPAVIGTAFYVMEFVDGRIFWHPELAELTPAQRGAAYDEMNRVIAAIHSVDPAAVGLADFGRPDGFVARQIDRWTKQYRASELERIEAMESLIEWLPRNMPADEPGRITHGDFRIDNLIFDKRELRIRAVIDWELATLGNALSDFAYNCMPFRMPQTMRKGLAGLDLAALGIPDEAGYAALYCRRTGRTSTPSFDFYIAFNLFRLAAILQGVAARARAGNASSERAVETGALTRPIAELGWTQAQKFNVSAQGDLRV
jgi:aminoglycoside phosphotransferase (APT) family kinase protein